MSIRECEPCGHYVLDNQVPFCPMCLLREVAASAERVLDLPAAGPPVEGEELAYRDLMAALIPLQEWERKVEAKWRERQAQKESDGQ